jgi:hypothetical protein
MRRAIWLPLAFAVVMLARAHGLAGAAEPSADRKIKPHPLPVLESPSVRAESLPRGTPEQGDLSKPIAREASRGPGRWVWQSDESTSRTRPWIKVGEHQYPFTADVQYFAFPPNSYHEPIGVQLARPSKSDVRRAGGVSCRGRCIACGHEHPDDELGFICPYAQGECCQVEGKPLDPNETAGQIIDVMERVGPSVLEGSLFQEARTADCPCPGECACPGACVCPGGCACPDGCGQTEDERTSLIKYLRHLERQEQSRRQSSGADCREYEYAELDRAEVVEESIDILRETSFDLDMAAHRLEGQNLYYRADQLRDLAAQLRQEARSAHAGWSVPRQRAMVQEQPLGAQRDLGLEVEQLREELRRVHEALNVTTETPLR